jgi:antitoxin PrlF
MQTTVSKKGQITIPSNIRRALGLTEGDSLAVEQDGERIVLSRIGSYAERSAGALAAYRLATPLTPREEREAFEQGVADEIAEELGM